MNKRMPDEFSVDSENAVFLVAFTETDEGNLVLEAAGDLDTWGDDIAKALRGLAAKIEGGIHEHAQH